MRWSVLECVLAAACEAFLGRFFLVRSELSPLAPSLSEAFTHSLVARRGLIGPYQSYL